MIYIFYTQSDQLIFFWICKSFLHSKCSNEDEEFPETEFCPIHVRWTAANNNVTQAMLRYEMMQYFYIWFCYGGSSCISISSLAIEALLVLLLRFPVNEYQQPFIDMMFSSLSNVTATNARLYIFNSLISITQSKRTEEQTASIHWWLRNSMFPLAICWNTTFRMISREIA